MRRFLLPAASVAAMVLLAVAVPANAKMPPYTCELSTARPVVGEPVTVVVRYWWDADHTEPAEMAIFRRYRGLIAVPIDHGAPGEHELGLLPLVLPRVSSSAYRGEVVFPDTRRFRIRWCDGGYDQRGYPLRAGVVVRPHVAARLQSGRASASIPIALGLIAAGVGLVGAIAARRTG